MGGRRDLTPTAAIFNAHVRDNLLFLYGAPACRVYHNAAQATTTGVAFQLDFNTERFDNDTMHGATTNVITFTTAGRYLLIANVEFGANATGYRLCRIRHFSVADLASEVLPVVSAAAATVMNVGTIYSFAAAAIAEADVLQTSGGNLNVNSTGNYSPEFMAHWMGN